MKHALILVIGNAVGAALMLAEVWLRHYPWSVFISLASIMICGFNIGYLVGHDA